MNKLELKVLLSAIDKATAPFKSIQASASAAAKALKGARDQLKDLNQTAARIEAFRKIEKDLAIVGNSFKAVQTRITELKAQIAQVPAPTKAMSKALQEAQREAEQLRQRHTGLIQTQQRLFEQMRAGGVDMHRLSDYSRELATRQIAATHEVKRLSEAFAVQDKRMKSLAAARQAYDKSMATRSSMQGAGMSTMLAGAAGTAITATAINAYSEQESAMTQLRNTMTDAAGKVDKNFDVINKKAIELGNALPGTTKDFIEAARALKEQGMKPEAIAKGGLEASAYLGVRLNLDQERTAEIIAKAREAHGLKSEDLPAAADYLHRTKTAFGLNHEDMFEAMKYSATDLNIKGQVGDISKMKEYLAMEGVASQQGLQGSSFGTNFSHMLKNMSFISEGVKAMKGPAGTYVEELLAKRKINLGFYTAKGNFAGFENMVMQLEKLKVLKPVEQDIVLKKYFDTEGSRPAAILMKLGVAGYRQALAQLENVQSLTAATEKMKKTFAYQKENVEGNAQNLAAALGKHLIPMAEEGLKKINGLIESISRFNDENPEIVAAAVKIAAGLATVVTVMGILLLAASGLLVPFAMLKFSFSVLGIHAIGFTAVLGKLGGALRIVGTALLWLGRLAFANPIGLAIMAIAAVAFLVYRYWEPITKWFSGLWAKFKVWGAAIIDGFIGGIKAKWEAIKDLAARLAGMLPEAVRKVLGIKSPSRVFQEIGQNIMTGLQQGIAGGAGHPITTLRGVSRRLAAAGAGIALAGSALAMPGLDQRPPLAGASAAGGSAHYDIHIHAAPGMDLARLARLVGEEIDRREAERAARLRSRLRDRD